MVMSAVPISPEGDDFIDFSNPYFTMEYMLLVLNEIDIKTRENLEGEAVGILNIEKKYLDDDYLLHYKISGYDDVVVMVGDLKNKNISGILISLPMGINLIKGDAGTYNVLEVVKSSEEFGIVFKEGNTLRDEVNKILEEIRQDGTYDEIYDKWFNCDAL
jgi:ABC-type amino acid transport substrate-binding protein